MSEIEFNYKKSLEKQHPILDVKKEEPTQLSRTIAYLKYSYVNVDSNSDGILEYVRYMRPDHMGNKRKYDNAYIERLIKFKEVNRRYRRAGRNSDSFFHPAFRKRGGPLVTKDNRLHKLINVILDKVGTKHELDQDTWDSMAKDKQYRYLYEAALELVHFVSIKNKKLNDINVVELRRATQVANRSKRVILWKSMATHMRFYYRKHRLSFDYKVLKWIADHHPRAEQRSCLRASEITNLQPVPKASEVTVLDSADFKRVRKYGLRLVNDLELSSHFRGYARWLKNNIPLTPVVLTDEEINYGLNKSSVEGMVKPEYKSTQDLIKSLRSLKKVKESKEYQDIIDSFDPEINILNLSKPYENLAMFARMMGIEPIHKSELRIGEPRKTQVRKPKPKTNEPKQILTEADHDEPYEVRLEKRCKNLTQAKKRYPDVDWDNVMRVVDPSFTASFFNTEPHEQDYLATAFQKELEMKLSVTG
jgi:hypothetical protein